MRFIQSTIAAISAAAMLATPLVSQAATTSAFVAGDLIKGTQFSTVYYFAPNGKRFVFPNEKTYFTWYKDFSTVKTITDQQLSAMPLGGNVTYRPGVKMLKITTDPRTYAVDQGGVLRQVGSESLAQTLYNINWKNKIDDLPDAFFINYRLGTPLQTASDYNPANVMTLTTNIMQDKQFDETKVTITIGDLNAGFVPTTITIKKGVEVTWTNRDNKQHQVVGTGFSSAPLDGGASYTRVFGSSGSFDYHDGISPVMQGTINVVP